MGWGLGSSGDSHVSQDLGSGTSRSAGDAQLRTLLRAGQEGRFAATKLSTGHCLSDGLLHALSAR